MDVPRECWARIAGTTPLERVNREIGRRADASGIFADDKAIVRLVGAFAAGLEPVATSWLTARDR